MADFPLSDGRTTNPPVLPLAVGDLIEISQFRAGVWNTAVITLGELVQYVQGAVEIDAARITSGTVPIGRGGTNATTEASARGNLGVPALIGNNTFTGDQAVTGVVSATGGFDDTSA